MIEFRVSALEETTSTNDLVKRAIEAGEPEGLAVRAQRQTGGYGRQGRSWASPAGGLYMSLLLRPDVAAGRLPTLSLATGLAVHRALSGLLASSRADVQLKWPNDVVCSSGKLCGISLEKHLDAVCVGIGVNVFPPARALEVGGKNRPAYAGELEPSLTLDTVAEAILAAFAPIYDAWRSQGLAPFVEELNAHASLTGRVVRMVDAAGAPLAEGRVERIDEHGRLVLLSKEGVRRAVASGEAHIV